MTNVKKVVAVMLAFLMIFSSASVFASAWDASVDDGSNLNIETKFFKEVNGEWVETTKVKPGDVVKARVYLGTDYYSNDSSLLFFYDKDFFTHSYGTAPTNVDSVNKDADSFAQVNGVTTTINASPKLTSLVNDGYIDSAFTSEYGAVSVIVRVNPSSGNNVKYDNSTWLFELDFTVADTASGEGDFFVKDTTVQNSTTQSTAVVNVPKGPATGTDADLWAMWLWDANVTLASNPVSTNSSVTFNANTGLFADGKETYVVEGMIDDAIDANAIPEVTKEGYAFMGWIDAADTTPTYEEIIDAVPTTIPEDDLVLNAYWMETVDITFDTDGGSTIASHIGVAPYSEFVAVANPTKDGFTFVGWDTRGNMTLPTQYPVADTTYKAIWAKDVVVSFETDGADPIESINGVAGEAFTATIADPSKEGHYFTGWSPALPTEFPTEDTTYTANFDTYSYMVSYYVDGELAIMTQIEYGMPIPTIVPVDVPDGKEVDGWYRNADYTDQLAVGTTMPVIDDNEGLKLYAQTTNKTYDAIFMVDGEEYERVPTVYEGDIIIPANPTKSGYVFTGWDPYPGTMDAGDMTFNAVWEEAENVIIYDVDGTEYEKFTGVAFGADLEIPADPDKEGYTFLGWSDVQGATAPIELPKTMPADAVTYYAVFEVNQYTITFDTDGGTAVDSITQDFGSDIATPTQPTKTGYTFAGWDTLPATMPAKDTTVKAKWTINQYTITFNTDGGTEVAPIKQDYNTAVTAPSDPTKTGYTFAGWDKEIPSTMPAENVTITAQWTINQYTITFDTDGGTEVDPITQDFDTAITAPTAPTKTGYTFAGWDALPTKMPAKDTTVKAQWTINQYTITFDTDGGTEVAPIKQDYNTAVTAPSDPTKTGYTFAGWDATIPTTMPAENITINAQWTINQYTITFNTDGGTEVAPIKQDYNTAVTAPSDPTKTGYTFAGWDATIPTTMPAENVTINAKWNINQYDVTWVFGNGDADKVETLDYNSAITAPTGFTKTGYSFTGWSPAVDATVPANDVTYTATWEANTYDAVFMVDGVEYDTVPTKFDDQIVAPADPTKEGYVFSAWEPTVGIMNNVNGLTFNAVWVNATDTKYTVKTYTMGTDGQYKETASQILSGETGAPVDATPASVEEGFKLNTDKSVLTGNIKADSSLLLEVYIDRNQYAFKVDNANGDEIASTDYYYGATVVTPAEPEKTGYTFDTWSPAVPATMPASDYTVTAQWTANSDTEYVVIVNYTDVATGAHTAENYFTGTTDNAIAIVDVIPDPAAENTEYVLMSDIAINNFKLDADAANELTGTVAPDGSTVLNVYFVPVDYTATFKANDGTYEAAFTDGETSKDVVLPYNTLVKENAPAAPVRVGYTFAGWQGVNDNTRLTTNRTFTATWTADNFTLTWNYNDGVTADKVETYACDALINKLAAPSREGYTFDGWKWTNADGDIVEPGNMPAYNVTATAQWTIKSHTITWVDGDSETTDTLNYGDTITAAELTKDGYTFNGWLSEEGKKPADYGTMPDADLKFTAQWTINQYTITFDTDGGSTVNSITQDYNTDITVTTEPTKTGYTFAGWNPEVPEKMPAGDMTVKAQWTINKYTITFNNDNGTADTLVEADYLSSVELPAEPAKDGYTFRGWATTKGVTDPAQAVVFPVTMPLNGTTYYAIWTANDYTITFDEDGGSDVQDITAAYGSAVTAPANPTKTGYTFNSWTPAFPSTMPLNGAALKATWDIESYTVNWVSDGQNVATGSVNYNAAVTAPETTKTGYKLVKWVDADGNTAPAVMPDAGANGATVTYTAVWEANTYDAVFNAGDGAFTDGEKSKTVPTAFDSAIVAPANPVRAGYTFNGWDPEVGTMNNVNGLVFNATWIADGGIKYTVITKTMNTDGTYTEASKQYDGVTDTAVDATPAMVAEGFELNAAASTLTGTVKADGSLVLTVVIDRKSYAFNTSVDGTANAPVNYLFGSTVVVPAEEVKTGYTFDGWYDGAAKYAAGAEFAMPARAVTLTGTFKINQYTITFNTDGGTDVAPITQDYNSAIVAPTAPTKTGYTFAGWDNLPATMPAENVTVKATWTANEYTITFDENGGTDVADITAAYGSSITAPAAPTKAGYTFAGWENANGEKVNVPATMPLNGLALKATWTINQYKVTFYEDDTLAKKLQETDNDYELTIVPPVATKEGHSFAGWYNAAGEKVDFDAGVKTPANDVYYYATWTVDNYDIVYRAQGGTFADDNSAQKTYPTAYGTAKADMQVPANPVRPGYTFLGWNIELPETMPASNVNLIAQWKQETYTVNWIDNDGEVLRTDELVYGADLVAPDATKEGYSFNGWLDAEGNSVEIPATMFDAGEDKAVVNFRADNVANEYDAVFNAGEGIFADGKNTATVPTAYDSNIVAPADPTRDGYTFGGWTPTVGVMNNVDGLTFEAIWNAKGDIVYKVITYTMNADGTYAEAEQTFTGATDSLIDVTPTTIEEGFELGSDSVTTGTVKADGSLILKIYLNRSKYNVTVSVDGVAGAPVEYLYGATVTVPADEVKEGYTFDGWKVNGVEYVAGATFAMPAKDVTIAGTFTVNQYDAIFNIDGSVITVGTDFGKVPVAPTATKAGYTFKGWSPELTAMTTAGATYTAVFEANTDIPYTVETYVMGLDGQYGAAEIENLKGTTDADATVTPDAMTGFTVADESVLTAKVKADGSTVLKVYYSRDKYTVTYKVDGEVYGEVEEYYYEADVAATRLAPTKTGYTFSGWSAQAPATMPAGNVEITGTFAINSYNLKYTVDGADYGTATKAEFNSTVTVDSYPVKEGYTFDGWYVDGTKYAAGDTFAMPANDVTVTGSFTVNKYNVIYLVDGAEFHKDTFDFKTAITPYTTEPTKEGYTFKGWDATLPATMPANDIILNAKFDVNQYNAEFYVDGVLLETVKTNFGEVPVAPTATKEGYTFVKWSPDLAAMTTAGAKYDAVFNANSGIAYTVETYKMGTDGKYVMSTPETFYGVAGVTATAETPEITGFTFNADASTVSAIIAGNGSTVLKVYYDRNKYNVTIDGVSAEYYYEAVIEKDAPAAATGYHFDKWVDEDGATVTFPFTVPAEDKEITSQFAKNEYTATFILDGASTDVKFLFEEVIVPIEAPAKEGYLFIGWQAADGSFLKSDATMPANNVTYTAIYEITTVGITYYVDNKVVGFAQYEYGEVIPTVIPTYTTPVGYTFDGWYTNVEMTAKLAEGATFGNGVTALYAKTTAKSYNAIFDANGGAWGTETTKTVSTEFGADIHAPATDPVREGYTFLGWDPYVGTMDEEGKTFTATWIETANAYSITYKVDGADYEVFTLALNDEFEIPADPEKQGYKFIGWATTADATAADAQFPATMPAENLTYYAVFEISAMDVTFYNFEALAETPYKTNDYVEMQKTTVNVGDTIAFPADPTNIDSAYWTFVGWSATEGGEVIADTSAVVMGEEPASFYAVYESVAVKLVPMAGSTTMIERNGVIESYNDGYTVTSDPYDVAEDETFDEYFIYGLAKAQRDTVLLTKYAEVQGDGYATVTPVTRGRLGTGTLVKVYKNNPDGGEVDILVEQFYVVIFGDLDGNSLINAADKGTLVAEIGNRTWSATRTRVPYMFKAANLDGNRLINAADKGILVRVIDGESFSQITGKLA